MTPQHHTGSAIPHFSLNSPPPAHVMVWHKGTLICPSTASQGAKTLCLHPIWIWDAVNGGSQPQPWHRNIIQARPYPIFPKTHLHLHTYYSIRMHPYAHLQHLKVLRHFVYIQYGCGMQSMGVWSLNHDTTTSYRLGHTPFSLTPPPTSTCNTAIMMHPYAHPQHLKMLRHCVYIQYGCGMQSMGVCSFNHDTTTSYRLGHTTFPLKLAPTCTCDGTAKGCNHMPIHSIPRW